MLHSQISQEENDYVGEQSPAPKLTINKLAIVYRDYNRRRDFSDSLREILSISDDRNCDTMLFALYTIVHRPNGKSNQPDEILRLLDELNLKHIKVVFVEKFSRKGTLGLNVVYYKTREGWRTYSVRQSFGSMKAVAKEEIERFVNEVQIKRALGNCCWLICGETNGVRYSVHDRKVIDTHGLCRAIPRDVTVILNPVHDRMTRFEMRLKRQFLSRNRWVVSVWNKGRKGTDGRTRDGQKPAWQVYHNGKEVLVEPIKIESEQLRDIAIGILEVS